MSVSIVCRRRRRYGARCFDSSEFRNDSRFLGSKTGTPSLAWSVLSTCGMSEAVAEKAEQTPAAAGGGGNKKLLFIVLAVNVLLVGGLGYVVISNKNHAEPAKAAGKAKAEGHEAKEEGEAEAEGEGHEAKEEGEAEEAEEEGKKDEKHPSGKFGPLLEIGSFVANLQSIPGQPPHFCKATVYVEVKNEEAKVAVEAAVVPIKAEALMMISNAHPDDVIGQEKITLLSAALLKRANKLVGKNAIKRVYFAELVVQ